MRKIAAPAETHNIVQYLSRWGGRGFQNLLHWTVTAGIVLVDSCSENEILFDGCVYEAFSNSLTKINVCYIKLIDSGARF